MIVSERQSDTRKFVLQYRLYGELVGLFLLDELAELLGKENVRLCRDDGLAIMNGCGPLIERTKKKILKLFQKHNLQVTTECNLVRTDFLDVSFD